MVGFSEVLLRTRTQNDALSPSFTIIGLGIFTNSILGVSVGASEIKMGMIVLKLMNECHLT